ncbi:MAG: hypothetical protein M0R40_09110 [Firmicutes bacterium]|nr:hypothetical protein [Bacillota bacterium]
MQKLIELLNYIESIIDLEHIEKTKKMLERNLSYKENHRPIFKVGYPVNEFLPFPYGEAVNDMEKMMYNELRGCLCQIENKDDGVPCIRANYGVGILPSVFGLNCRIVNNSMPWVDHIDNLDDVKKVISGGVPNFNNGLGKKVIETYEFFNEMLDKYPKCREGITMTHPDFKGPFDVAHLIVGSDLYYTVYDDPDMVFELLDLIVETYILFMRKVKHGINDEYNENCYHWGNLFGGKVLLRDDTPVNLSVDLYKEFVRPFDAKVLKAFGGGSIHYCGKAEHWVLEMAKTPNLKGLNFGTVPGLKYGQGFLKQIVPTLSEQKVPIVAYRIAKAELDEIEFNRFKNGITYAISFDTREIASNFVKSLQV